MRQSILFLLVILFAAHRLSAQSRTDYKVRCLSTTQKGEKIVTGGNNGLVQIWNSEGKLIKTINIDAKSSWGSGIEYVQKVAISPNGNIIVAACNNQKVYFYRSNGQLISEKSRESNFDPIIKFYNNGANVFLAYRHLVKVDYDSSGNQLSSFNFDPEKDLASDKRRDKELMGAEVTKKGDFIFVYKVTTNKKKDYYEHYLSEHSKNNRFLGSTKLEFNQSMYRVELSYSDDIAFVYGSCMVKDNRIHEGFLYDMQASRIDKVNAPKEENLSLNPNSKGYICTSNKEIRYFDSNFSYTSNKSLPFPSTYSTKVYFSPDYSVAIGTYEDKFPEVYNTKNEKLLAFDDSITAEDISIESKPLQVSPYAITQDKPKVDLSGFAMFSKVTYPKTLTTNLSGCVAGDCFDGFGYLIISGTEEFCGYFTNGVKESIGQLLRTDEGIVYNGFFKAEMPNGYGNISFFENGMTELGTFNNLNLEGEITFYSKEGNVKDGFYDGNQTRDYVRATGCLSGDCNNGNGVYQKEKGIRLVGDFENGLLTKGVIFDGKDRVVNFEKVNHDGKYIGMVDLFKKNGEVVHGTFLDGFLHGHGIIKSSFLSKTLYVEGEFKYGSATKITIQFRDGRKWIGTQSTDSPNWATGTGTMTYPDGYSKTGKFKDGEFISE